MALLHFFLNIVLIPSTFFLFLFLVPLYYFIRFLWLIIRYKHHETVAGKVVLITGASSGIGEDLAYEYARRGARLALVARREDRLRAVLEKARKLGSSDAIMICADVSNIDDCERFINATLKHFGQLDHLVNNAGVTQAKLFEDFSPKFSDLAPMMDINFWGSVYPTHFAVPHLRKSRGKIVAIASSVAWYPVPRLSFYNASKAAMTSFFDTLRAELGQDIGVTIVTPGIIRTEMTPDPFLSEICMKSFPAESAESCAKAIVDSTCRGDLYLTVPSWNRLAAWYKMFCPVLVDWWWFYNLSQKGSPRTSDKHK